MRAYDVILKKRNGGELTSEEIGFMVNGYVEDRIPDYQMSALAMAIYFQGLNERETTDLTRFMVESGDQVDLSGIQGFKADKHSTGGVGDKTTLVLAPLVAAAGVKVAKMSGRGLGHTGGTLDKLQSIPGFSVEFTPQEFVDIVNRVGVAVVGQTGNLVPADKKLYALRDVTATVDSLPLIASSVMSKKIAAGADAILLDVKVGSGAFMKRLEDAVALARLMVNIGSRLGRNTRAVITNMDQPLGRSVGNALEVREAIETLQGRGPEDLTELCLILGGHMLHQAGRCKVPEEGKKYLEKLLDRGDGLAKLKEMIAAQKGLPEVVHNLELLPQAPCQEEFRSPAEGVVEKINAEAVGLAAMILGAGRETKESSIDLSAGIVLHKKVGDAVAKDEVLAVLHSSERWRIEAAREKLREAYIISNQEVKPQPLIYEVISEEN
ncbi:pyrimidine-nucleoside phosphorylase [Calderihabitans maritimus]|uniref:Pyrimidine-nucleoside phosphorylase n=1 Tax=Calderihabitans maritimus TaxID=1246530 RepID=A0A1Z5HQV0_9FIRM|nr:pyrimidine-nucleoside phosphorylase [Calderihabitans maritimus]GAW91685.1 pyrimidine-nucleoside phosphorylase [Calderihabitans maritimus]